MEVQELVKMATMRRIEFNEEKQTMTHTPCFDACLLRSKYVGDINVDLINEDLAYYDPEKLNWSMAEVSFVLYLQDKDVNCGEFVRNRLRVKG